MSKLGAALTLREYYVSADTPSKYITYYDSVPINRETYIAMKEKFPGYRVVEKHSVYKGQRYHDFILVLPMELPRSW